MIHEPALIPILFGNIYIHVCYSAVWNIFRNIIWRFVFIYHYFMIWVNN